MIDTDWRQLNRSFFDVLAVESNVMFAILALIMLVAALNIISGLIMLVQDKARAIAVLRTMGATRGAVMRIFLITGATIGVVGTFVGLILGLARGLQRRADPAVPDVDDRPEPVSVGILLPVAASLPGRADDVLAVVGLALVLSIAATIYPSWRAASSIRWRRCAMNDAGRFAALALDAVERRYGRGETTVEVLNGASLDALPGAVGRADRALGRRQVDAAASCGPAGAAERRRDPVGGAPTSTMSDDSARR